MDSIALKKLVNFVNTLMEQYFNFVQQRVQLEVGLAFVFCLPTCNFCSMARVIQVFPAS